MTAAVISPVCPTVIVSPTARADPGYERFSPNDFQYLQNLASAGLNPATLGLPSLTQEVALGQGTCGALDRASINDVDAGIKRHWPNLSDSQVNTLVRSSVTAYCQYNSGKLS
ncbi:DUF732 domain-containing protein [Mycobacterium malmoense]|uniref:DUF732 domain-containing protein n=1 Tax=Mycobacterium malmoense TaxID=1780 RepID=UPI001428C664|nr:DUF732 domain-containing protein [Mycobacterium malmoense]